MRQVSIFVCVAATCIAAIAVAQVRKDARPTITTNEITQAQVVGAMGVPLGTCVDIQATIVKDKSNSKGSDGHWLLEVTHVDGHKLRAPARYDFSIHQFHLKSVTVSNNPFDLYKLRTGKDAKNLARAQIEELEAGYIGTVVNLTVYETGTFSGIPEQLPSDCPVWQDRGFGFSTHLSVVAQK